MDPADTAVQLTVTDSSGDWIPPDSLHESAIEAWRQGMDVKVSLESLEHLDASALQILIALAASLQRDAHRLELANPPAALERWFSLAGATALLRPAPKAPTNAEVSS
jgi:anti-anti-sigma regulatory factor